MQRTQERHWPLAAVSRHRTAIMGAAALWIVFYHSHLNLHAASGSAVWTAIAFVLDTIRRSGNAGVDIFLLLSGFGLYFSLSRDERITRFYFKRAQRLLPPFLIVSVLWNAREGLGAAGYVRRVLLLDFFSDGNTTFWYVNLLVILYILYPFLHRCFNRSPFAALFGGCALSAALTLALYFFAPSLYTNIHLALPRIPVFLCGVLLGKLTYEKKSVPRFVLWASAACVALMFTVLLVLNVKQLPFPREIVKYYTYCPFAVSLTLCAAALFDRPVLRGVQRLCGIVGRYSFEIYLLYEKLAVVCVPVFLADDRTHTLYYVPVFVLTMVLAVLLHEVCARITHTGTEEEKRCS